MKSLTLLIILSLTVCLCLQAQDDGHNFGKSRGKYIAPKIYPSSTYSTTSPESGSEVQALEDGGNSRDTLSNDASDKTIVPEFKPMRLHDSPMQTKKEAPTQREGDPDTTMMAIGLPPRTELNTIDKFRLQDDTIRQLEYEIKKIKLEKELDELRNHYPPSPLSRQSRFNDPTDSILLSQRISQVTPDSANLKSIEYSGLSSVMEDSTSLTSIPADAMKFDKMQNDIDNLRSTLNSRESSRNQSADEKAANDLLLRKIDALSYELRNRQQVTRIVERQSVPASGNQPDPQTTIAIINLQRRMKLLSDEVNIARSNSRSQDSSRLILLQDATRKESGLQQKIDTLNAKLEAAGQREDSIKRSIITAERDSLQMQVKRLQESFEKLKSKTPDTVTRAVITIPELPKTEVFFKVNSSVLSSRDNQRIREVADIIAKYPQVHVMIRGYTDMTGSLKYNLMLSEKRAKAVEQVLIASRVPSNKIVTESNGVDHDLEKKSSEYGRRVEIILSTD